MLSNAGWNPILLTCEPKTNSLPLSAKPINFDIILSTKEKMGRPMGVFKIKTPNMICSASPHATVL